jgi:predicted dithiol-disulfide oxidoreductase (DUF899 family)
MGWGFKWVSSYGNDFNYDFQVSVRPEDAAAGKVYYNYEMGDFQVNEMPGLSVFTRNASGEIFHSYSTYARGLDILIDAYNFLDLVPKGRDEAELPWPWRGCGAMTTMTTTTKQHPAAPPDGVIRQ